MKIKTADVMPPALDWLVATIVQPNLTLEAFLRCHDQDGNGLFWHCWSTDWSRGGPLIHQEGIDLHQIKHRPFHLYDYNERLSMRYPHGELVMQGDARRWKVPRKPSANEGKWLARMSVDRHPFGWRESDFLSPTPLIAAMRCWVASVQGDEVDVPDELLMATDDESHTQGDADEARDAARG